MHDFSLAPDLQRLVAALLIGAVVGAEREYRSKSAGLRTMILISVSAALFTILSYRINMANPDRIAANIITGIGFLGAGIIFKDENGGVSGLTTASSIWVVAGLGMACGAGYLKLAAIVTVIVILVLIGLIYVQNWIDNTNQLRKYKIVCNYKQETLKHYETLFKAHHLTITRGKQSKMAYEIIGNWQVRGSVKNHEKLIHVLLNDAEIKEFDF